VFLQNYGCPEINNNFFSKTILKISLFNTLLFSVFYHNYIISSILVMHRLISVDPNSIWQQKKKSGSKTIVEGSVPDP